MATDLLYLAPGALIAASYLYRRCQSGSRGAPVDRTDWCAGCDQLRTRIHMKFDADGRYRCDTCRDVYCNCAECKQERAEERERETVPSPPAPPRQHAGKTLNKIRQQSYLDGLAAMDTSGRPLIVNPDQAAMLRYLASQSVPSAVMDRPDGAKIVTWGGDIVRVCAIPREWAQS